MPSVATPHSSRENVHLAGRAEDHSLVLVDVPERLEPTLQRMWPPIGLERIDGAAAEADKVVSVRSAVAGTFTVEVDGQPTTGGWARVESELALFAAERLGAKVAVHAAGIAHNGRALVVPGPSGAGKSRLCVAAAAAGATVLTDEYVIVDPADGTVTGWPREVRVRRPDGGVDRVDLVRPMGAMPVGLVAALAYVPGPPLIEEISAADGVLAILANTVCAQSRPDHAMDGALAVGRSCPAVGGTRGEADAAISDLLKRMAT